MHDDSGFVLPRVARFVRERLTPALHRASVPARVAAWTAPGEPVPFAEARRQEYRPFAVGEAWGRPWGTVWFHVTGAVPARVGGTRSWWWTSASPARGPASRPRARCTRPTGSSSAASNPAAGPFPLAGGAVDLYVEAAANPDMTGGWGWAPTPLGDLATAGDDAALPPRRGRARRPGPHGVGAAAGHLDVDGLVEALPGDLPRRAEVLRALERAVDAVDPGRRRRHRRGGPRRAGRRARPRPRHASAHRVYAVGHAHIDSAWLWPVRETVRKVARTFANALQLMETDDELVFAASSAQQYAWMRDHQPELFARIRKRTAEGRFVPVGGMWVESDTNMPGGEALARQLVHGAGLLPRASSASSSDGVWLPDSFGYSAALPQIAAAAGRRWFLTQKISWNDTNRFPHHTFDWEGIDGTRIFTHFPPVDTYNAELSGGELARAQRQFAEKGRANTSLVPFGWGDGGGGPTREMLAAAHRTRDLEGSPTVRARPPDGVLRRRRGRVPGPAGVGRASCTWSTTAAPTPRRRARSAATGAASTCCARPSCGPPPRPSVTGAAYPVETLRRCWETVLLQQFHDILPGTSIAWVHRQAEREYARVADELEGGRSPTRCTLLVGPGDRELAANAGPYAVDGVPGAGRGDRRAGPRAAPESTSSTAAGGRRRARADHVDLRQGRPSASSCRRAARRTSCSCTATPRPTGTPGTSTGATAATRVDLVEGAVTTARAIVRIVRRRAVHDHADGQRCAARTVEIDTHVDWHERQKLLKLAFPLDVHADRAASEIQFGHVHRPTHANTSWDAARFETCAHRWVHVGEPGYGVAVANDAHVRPRHHPRRAGGTTTVRLSLLRAPLFPDPDADQGEHRFRVALRVGATIGDAVAEGYRLNLPLRRVRGGDDVAPLRRGGRPGRGRRGGEARRGRERRRGGPALRGARHPGRVRGSPRRSTTRRWPRPTCWSARCPSRSRSTAIGCACARSRSSPCGSSASDVA